MVVAVGQAWEQARIRSVYATRLLDSGSEARFRRFVLLAAEVFDVKEAAFALVAADEVFFKTGYRGVKGTVPRADTPCDRVVREDDLVVLSHPEGIGDHGEGSDSFPVRFYAGVPVHSTDGYPIAALCVMHDEIRELSARDQSVLWELGRLLEEEVQRTDAIRFNEAIDRLLQLQSDFLDHPLEGIRQALELACDFLKLPIGIVSEIQGESYTVLVQNSPDGALEDGQSFNLGETYCHLLEARGDVLAIEHMGQSPYAGHPCYQVFELESYIGIPLWVSKRFSGTLNFSSPEPRQPGGFSELDRNFVRRLAEWVVSVLEYHEKETAISKHRKVDNLVADVQASFIDSERSDGAFVRLVDGLLQITSAQLGALYGADALDSGSHSPWRAEPLTCIRIHGFGALESRALERVRNLARQGAETGEIRMAEMDLFDLGEALPTLMVPVFEGDRLSAVLILSGLQEQNPFELVSDLKPALRLLGQLVAARASQQALRISESRLAGIIEATNVGTWEWDVDTGETVVNERCARILGYTLSELEPINMDSWLSRLHPDDRKSSEEALKAHLSGQEPYFDLECRARHRDGHWVWVHNRGRVVHWTPSGHPRLMAGTHTDITRQKLAEEELRISEQRFRGFFEMCPVGIAISDLHSSELLDANQALLNQTGYSRTELLCQKESDLLSGDGPAADQKRIQSLIEKGRYGPEERELNRRDGENYPALIQGVLLRESSGRELVWSVVEDITERKRLANMQRQFVSTVSHELRTPLTSLNGILRLLDAGVLGVLPDRAAEMVARAYANGRRLSELINDLLDVEKLVAGKMTIRPEPVDIAPLASKSVSEIEGFANEQSVSIRIDDREDAGVVVVDPARFQQIMTNFLSNAIKFSSPGRTVRVVLSRPRPAVTRISVIDEGEGVPEAFRPMLFKAFSQADSSDTRRRPGTGLGLSICRELAEKMKGQVGYQPVTGGGSEFFVDFPRLTAPIKNNRGEAST